VTLYARSHDLIGSDQYVEKMEKVIEALEKKLKEKVHELEVVKSQLQAAPKQKTEEPKNVGKERSERIGDSSADDWFRW